MCKVEKDLLTGDIDQETADYYLILATEIIEDLDWDPNLRICN